MMDLLLPLTSKTAEIGGDGQDTEFEQAFSSMVHAYIAAKAPGLQPYEVGFQLLERTDNGEKAVGITGFSVGDKLLYVPAFWLRGKIKGTELLWIDSAKTFVPLKESWLDYIMRRKPQRIGSKVKRDLKMLGVRQPLLADLNGRNKTATTLDRMVADIHREEFGRKARAAWEEMKKAASFDAECDLVPRLVRSAGPAGIDAVRRLTEQAPTLAKTAAEFYGDRLFDALRYAAAMPKTARRNEALMQFEPPLQVHRNGADVTFTDKRAADAVSRVWNVRALSRFFNPPETGLYDIITHTHGARKCFVICDPVFPDGHAAAGQLTVIDLEGGYVTADRIKVWACHNYTDAEYRTWRSELPKIESVGATELYHDLFALVHPGKGTSGILRGRSDFVDVPEGRKMEVSVWDPDRIRFAEVGCEKYLVVDDKPGLKFRALAGTLSVPNDTRYLRIDQVYDNKLDLQSQPTIDQLMGGCEKLDLFTDVGEVRLKIAGKSGKSMSGAQAMIDLVAEHGCREQTAREMLAKAASSPGGFASFYIRKQAYDPYLQQVERFAPYGEAFPQPEVGYTPISGGDAIQTEEPISTQSDIDVPREQAEQRTIETQSVNRVDGDAADMAAQAASSGQRDLFDASTLITMLRTMRDDELIDRSIPVLASALGETGTLLLVI